MQRRRSKWPKKRQKPRGNKPLPDEKLRAILKDSDNGDLSAADVARKHGVKKAWVDAQRSKAKRAPKKPGRKPKFNDAEWNDIASYARKMGKKAGELKVGYEAAAREFGLNPGTVAGKERQLRPNRDKSAGD